MRKSLSGLLRVAALAVTLLPTMGLHAVSWFPFGPDGGDARAFAADPHDHTHIYLGTAIGWMYDSHDSGKTWKRLARLGNRDDLVIDNIVVDASEPNVLYAGTWVLDRPDGGFYTSRDAGKTWAETPSMRGQSIRSLSVAPSNPRILVAGTLEGVFRSADGGVRWLPISPVGSDEIHEVESIAIDPKDPKIIYAGTWHLPWKTTDGGEHWKNIKEGIIDDSDVFSIIVHPTEPSTVYASACSGIYKSGNAGEKFTKIQGIPSTARRTRVLLQDPKHLDTVFAGTTEGLWRTADAGATWRRTTDPSVIVNDVYVDEENTNHVLLATDRGGILMSDDGGFSFRPSNSGFTSRQVTAYVADERNPAKLLIGVINDKDAGGVFVSGNGGLTWDQTASGLNGFDVLALAQAPDGTFIAGTSHGIFRLQGAVWVPSSGVSGSATAASRYVKPAVAVKGRRPAPARPVPIRAASGPSRSIDGPASAIVRSGNTLYATTGIGVLQSNDSGMTWQATKLTGSDFRYASAAPGGHVVVAGLNRIAKLNPATHEWGDILTPTGLAHIVAVSVDGTGRIWAGGREGIYRSTDGMSWSPLSTVRLSDINSIYLDSAGNRMLITANTSTTLTYAIGTADDSTKFWDTGWHLRFNRPVGDHFVGVTLYDGVVVQPRMVESVGK